MEFFDGEELGKGRRYEHALDREDNNYFQERFHEVTGKCPASPVL
jgi:hypothetical protein